MKQTKKSVLDTSFHNDTVSATPNELITLFGKPMYYTNDGNNFHWDMEDAFGNVFTIYDWKHYHPLNMDETINWHIGGRIAKITKFAAYHLQKKIDETFPKLFNQKPKTK